MVLRTLKFLCMNPAVVFKEMARNARCVVLASGTLSPISSFESELGVKFSQKLQANHVISEDQVMVRVIPKGPKGLPLHAISRNCKGSTDFQVFKILFWCKKS